MAPERASGPAETVGSWRSVRAERRGPPARRSASAIHSGCFCGPYAAESSSIGRIHEGDRPRELERPVAALPPAAPIGGLLRP